MSLFNFSFPRPSLLSFRTFLPSFLTLPFQKGKVRKEGRKVVTVFLTLPFWKGKVRKEGRKVRKTEGRKVKQRHKNVLHYPFLRAWIQMAFGKNSANLWVIWKFHWGTMKLIVRLFWIYFDRCRRCCKQSSQLSFRRLALLDLCFGLDLFSSDRDRPLVVKCKCNCQM